MFSERGTPGLLSFPGKPGARLPGCAHSAPAFQHDRCVPCWTDLTPRRGAFIWLWFGCFLVCGRPSPGRCAAAGCYGKAAFCARQDDVRAKNARGFYTLRFGGKSLAPSYSLRWRKCFAGRHRSAQPKSITPGPCFILLVQAFQIRANRCAFHRQSVLCASFKLGGRIWFWKTHEDAPG